MSAAADQIYDIAVIGGGVNGCGIARDAAGRGAKVLLLEEGDLANGTSSASTKQEIRRLANNRVENSHMTVCRRQRAMLRFRRMKTLTACIGSHWEPRILGFEPHLH